MNNLKRLKKMRKIIFSVLAIAIVGIFVSLTYKKEQTEAETMLLIKTNYGEMKVKLYNDTPKHRDNFIKLAKEGFFDGTLFHRVIKGFMIQGGDPESKNAKSGQQLGEGGPEYTIPAEFVPAHFHKKGALAAARMGDNVNPKKESSGSQFYIVQGKTYTEQDLTMMEARRGIKYTEEQRKAYLTVGGTPMLDQNYTVFGEVVEGFDVIDKIAEVKTANADRPVEDVKMEVKVIK